VAVKEFFLSSSNNQKVIGEKMIKLSNEALLGKFCIFKGDLIENCGIG